MEKIAFIGAGNMGGAIISQMISSGEFKAPDIYVCDKNISDEIKKLGVCEADIESCVKNCPYVVLAVKPNVLNEVLSEIKGISLYEANTYISIAAGRSIESISRVLGSKRIVRVMPNICIKAGGSMSVVCPSDECSEENIKVAVSIFKSGGEAIEVKESLIDACTAINGSGPAYVFMFIEALADGAVKHGIDRKTAYILAAQTVFGSAKLMLDSSVHPAALKDMVCSPGGTTIEAVARLEEKGLRDAVISAVDACVNKAKSIE